MIPTVTFLRGGVHPHDFKALTNREAIRNAPVPAMAVIPLQQHMGSPAEAVVQVNDKVREGMEIGKAKGAFSAPVHASIPGAVKELRDTFLPVGTRCQSVVIGLEGEFEQSGKLHDSREWRGCSPQELKETIRAMGIVGLGGATFPTPLKYNLNLKEGFLLDCFVANGVECEPFLTADHRLMLEKTSEILEGMEIAARILQPKRMLIGIEENKPDALEAMEKGARERNIPCEVRPLKLRYPQGDEKLLLKALIGKEVPSGGLPLDIGAVVSNVGTLFAVYEAVVLGKPLIERVVTVSGTLVKKPGNLKVRLGTRVGELIEECGGFTTPPVKLIAGGPMMGFALADLDTPVTKSTSGIIALSEQEAGGRVPQTACLSCGRCLNACPWGLSPTIIYKWIDHGYYQEALQEGLMDCKECGCCAYVCPARIPLVQGMKLGKLMSRKLKK